MVTTGIECQRPVQPHYNLTNLQQDVYLSGRNVTITCVEGYVLVGNATVTCSRQGTWKPQLPHCMKPSELSYKVNEVVPVTLCG